VDFRNPVTHLGRKQRGLGGCMGRMRIRSLQERARFLKFPLVWGRV